MRTGISYQGMSVLGVCFEDVAQQLPDTPSYIWECVKMAGLGKHNVAKDFLPTNSTNLVIRRGSNSHSRKYTVILLEKLPVRLKDTLIEGEKKNYVHGRYFQLSYLVCLQYIFITIHHLSALDRGQ